MKTPFALVAFLCGLALSAVAQHPLVGTWNMISVKGIDADGNRFFLDTTSVKETKIITPTHYMLIAWDVESDSLIFNRTSQFTSVSSVFVQIRFRMNNKGLLILNARWLTFANAIF